MNDLISRQAALDAAECIVDHHFITPYRTMRSAIDHLKRIIGGLPSAQPEQQWIPVTERLPNVRQWVLCQCQCSVGMIDVLRLTADGSWEQIYPQVEYMSSFVVAWMPLPEPYMEVSRMSDLKLKPCPFCGKEAEMCSAFENKFLGKYWYVRCKTCYSRGSGIYESGKELEPNEEYEAIVGAWKRAVEAWNRRAGEQDGRDS